jgi:hypothetical protein
MRLKGIDHCAVEQLLEHFRPSNSKLAQSSASAAAFWLLEHLISLDGPDLWVGSSLSSLNFCARGIEAPGEDVPPLAFACGRGDKHYEITYPVPREFRRHPDEQVLRYAGSVEQAAMILLEAIAHSDANPDRLSADWLWYVCPKCDLHAPNYNVECIRCRAKFPAERKCHLMGIWRRPQLPSGAVSLRTTTS